MADDRERNQGMQQGGKDVGGGGGQQAPGRNPQDDRSAGGQQPDQKREGGDFDPNKGGDGGAYKEGGQNEQETRR
jgi:hypothetical protein